jgi:hypothetical protein
MKIGKNIIHALLLGIILSFTACSKDDGAIPENIGIEKVPAITTNLVAGGTAATITFTDQAAFKGNFKVDMYFPGETPPSKVDVVVRKNAANGSTKVFKADVTTFPGSICGRCMVLW